MTTSTIAALAAAIQPLFCLHPGLTALPSASRSVCMRLRAFLRLRARALVSYYEGTSKP